jgi:hypothetical protein
VSRAKRAPFPHVVLIRVLIPAWLGLFMVVAGVAEAGGVGGYVEGEYATSNINDHGIDRGFDAGMGGFGVLYDGTVAVDELLNYRMSFGYHVGDHDFDDGGNKTVNGFVFDNTLGYGLLRTSRYRLWGGPSVRLNFDWYGLSGDVDVVDVGIGIGPRLGVNLHLDDQISLTTSFAYHYTYLSEVLESNGSSTTVDGPQHTVGINFGILWRFEDDVWGD